MTRLPERLKTIITESEFILKEKGSSFISISKPAENEEEAVSFLNLIRKKYYDATHHCYAYKFIDGTDKYSDDGEPGGTAGKRILNAVNHFEVSNVITIVIRYYGGVKLGAGPLGKAYYESAAASLRSAKIEERLLFEKVDIQYNFEDSSLLHHLISKYSIVIKESLFDPKPIMICLVLSSLIDHFSIELKELSKDKIRLNRRKEYTYRKG
ncbi:MAG: hypothetical protein CVV24_09785 [Ignavibacteriae bacterium HGW-Ignavibacteriae-3]|nr:MAG: hypothetical protein CVV24_09785 [Ignavibacteriae bacterium HGW-Ignavibacteriae-3]